MTSSIRGPRTREHHGKNHGPEHGAGARPVGPSIRIAPATGDADWAHARDLVLEHVYWWTGALGIREPLAVESGIRGELADLRMSYTPPHGIRYLAWLDGRPVGTCGFMVEQEGMAELKRLYVRPEARGHNLGELLVGATVAGAATLGCRTICLATKPGLMDTAIGVYRRLGFTDIEPFGDLDVADALYLARPVHLMSA